MAVGGGPAGGVPPGDAPMFFAFSDPQALAGRMVGTFRVSITNPGIRTLGSWERAQ